MTRKKNWFGPSLVLIILLLLLGIGFHWVMGRPGRFVPPDHSRAVAMEALGSARCAVEQFQEDHGRLPSVEEFYSPAIDAYVRGGREYLKDPYTGEPIQYWLDETSARGYRIASVGPDQVRGTDDDIHPNSVYGPKQLRWYALLTLRRAGDAVERFREEHGRLPSADELYSPLVDAYVVCGWANLEDPYTLGRFRYWEDDASTRGFCLASSGPDGVPETDDDILLDEAVEQ